MGCVILQLTQLCLIYIWIYLEVHVKGAATEGRGRSGAEGTASKMHSARRSQASQKACGWEMSRPLIFSPSLALAMPSFLQLLIMMIIMFLVCMCLCTRVQWFLAKPNSVGHCQMVQKLTGISFSNKPQTWMS